MLLSPFDWLLICLNLRSEFTQPLRAAPSANIDASDRSREKLFNQYKGLSRAFAIHIGAATHRLASGSDEAIDVNGTFRLFQDIDVQAEEDVVMLVLAYECKSFSAGEWPKKEFLEGLKALRFESTSRLC